eukprot:1174835-Heterocapsa_arctica.AAC.1
MRAKEQCAAMKHSYAVGSPGVVGSWDALRSCLRELLKKGSREVNLSDLKRIFRMRFRADLSETALGHSKLFD